MVSTSEHRQSPIAVKSTSVKKVVAKRASKYCSISQCFQDHQSLPPQILDSSLASQCGKMLDFCCQHLQPQQQNSYQSLSLTSADAGGKGWRRGAMPSQPAVPATAIPEPPAAGPTLQPHPGALSLHVLHLHDDICHVSGTCNPWSGGRPLE